MAEGSQEKLLSSLVAEIKSYNGPDSLFPWIQGIQKMKDSLPPSDLKEKLPRFLQKCAQTFETDRRYRNDARYIGVWMHLMDFVGDAKPLLKMMEKNRIGTKRAVFYCAYAMYYEKRKKFEASEKMYRMGVQVHAEPVDDLHRAYEQFLERVKVHKNRKAKLKEVNSGNRSSSRTISFTQGDKGAKKSFEIKRIKSLTGLDKGTFNPGDNTIIVKKFVGSAIDGNSEAEDACHHGLVDPTINMKEAMNAISNMFREPLEAENLAKRKNHPRLFKSKHPSEEIEIFVDENLDQGPNLQYKRSKLHGSNQSDSHAPLAEAFTILEDNEQENIDKGKKVSAMDVDPKINKEPLKPLNLAKDEKPLKLAAQDFYILADDRIEDCPKKQGADSISSCKFEELFEPTVFTKEAMEEINQLFSKPLDS